MKRALLVGLVALLGIPAAGCDRDDDAATDAAGPGIHHVHGLDIDPADQTLYAATHYGLFRVPDGGDARRVGDSYQDTMGFTIVGPRHFLGSGHPDAQTPDLPPLLGLIESTDAGHSWEPLSLLGEADFHALAFRHGLVYGYDATNERFMVSTDRESWDTRSQLADLIAFAVDPSDPEHVRATTTSGLLTSTDGGRSWNLTPTPPLAFISWADDGKLAAAGADAGVYVSADGGASWTGVGQLPGLPEAFLAVDRATFVAAVQELGLYASTDSGKTWRLRYRDQPVQ
jgi:photosystem II stability/assembly factor-like uncharacterized protein